MLTGTNNWDAETYKNKLKNKDFLKTITKWIQGCSKIFLVPFYTIVEVIQILSISKIGLGKKIICKTHFFNWFGIAVGVVVLQKRVDTQIVSDKAPFPNKLLSLITFEVLVSESTCYHFFSDFRIFL